MALNGSNNLQTASSELKSELQSRIESLKMMTDFVCIRDGRIVLVDINVDVILNRSYRKFEDELRIKIQRRMDSFFSLSKWDYGQTLRDSDLMKSVSDLKEIDRFEFNFNAVNFPQDGTTITTNFYEIIRPSTNDIVFTYQ